jgi:hypothetical protein
MENIEGVLLAITQAPEISLSAPGGGEGTGEVGKPPPGATTPESGTHLTLPVADATGPLPLPPKGRRGHDLV